jgi:phospholipid transport system transporter-binding protein
MSPAAQAPSAVGPLRLSTAAPGQMLVQGPLTFYNARDAAELGSQAISAALPGALLIDCAGVSACDSAGLAVLLEWLGVARSAQRSLCYENLPDGLRAIARISDLDELLTRGV